jgi:hemerythrin superfamily protein
MTEDHWEVNEQIKSLFSGDDKLQSKLRDEIFPRLRRHIFIEEIALFPTLPESAKEEVEYLEKEHGMILATVNQAMNSKNYKIRKEKLLDLYDLLVEHNSYEESFIYGHFHGKDASTIRSIGFPSREWKSLYERTFP